MGTERADIRLVEEAISTEDHPFEAFFAAEWSGLFRALLLMTGCKQEAEDLKQLAFLKVYERCDSIEHDRIAS